jgi:hypothetical protein
MAAVPSGVSATSNRQAAATNCPWSSVMEEWKRAVDLHVGLLEDLPIDHVGGWR